ncbi:MAG: hypothetical protein ACE5GD_01005 [Candidatus Geothermarchaeales archaeon]
MYKVGMYGPGAVEALDLMVELGLDAVFTEPNREYVGNARDRGLKAYVHAWTFKAQSDEEKYGVENIYGEKMLWSGAGCPNNPELRRLSLKWVEEALTRLDVDGVVLDGVRFPSPGNGLRTFLTCFCEYCVEKAKALGYDLPPIGEYLRGLHDPVSILKASVDFPNVSNSMELMDWMSFRCMSIAEHVQDTKRLAGSIDQKAEVGAALFTPSLAPLVGQSYADLCSILDFIQPMVYHRGDGVACVNFELGRLVGGFVEGDVRRDVLGALYDLLGIAEHEFTKDDEELLEVGLPLTIINTEVMRAKELVRTGIAKLTPIVFIIDASRTELEAISKQALDPRPDGLVYFAYHEALKTYCTYSAPKGKSITAIC